MNQNWKNFLTGKKARFLTDTNLEFPIDNSADENFLYPLAHFSILTVTGEDAARFLQGQITCNINDIDENKSSFGAFCNAKGRVITTFLLIKAGEAFDLVFPVELLDVVRKKLQMYIFRADVVLTDKTDEYCLIGLTTEDGFQSLQLPSRDLETIGEAYRLLKLPSDTPRYILLAESGEAQNFWRKMQDEDGFHAAGSNRWRYLDIVSGIPWVSTVTTEEFIPQMLNLDKLGGVSFNKGCYTGQEIIARTHYLGKAKREMYLAESESQSVPEPNSQIMDMNGQSIGRVLMAQPFDGICKMLVVLPTIENHSETLTLNNPGRDKIRILKL